MRRKQKCENDISQMIKYLFDHEVLTSIYLTYSLLLQLNKYIFVEPCVNICRPWHVIICDSKKLVRPFNKTLVHHPLDVFLLLCKTFTT